MWYLDDDGDGYGHSLTQLIQCNQPSGYVSNASDCDDLDPNTFPGASEYCNGLDNNCSGLPDDNALDSTLWYLDGDGDGYGLSTDWLDSCEQPTGYSAVQGDCDDGSAAVFPTADERCNGYDDNCDGLIDDSSAIDQSEFFLDLDGDGYGQSTVGVVSCNQPLGFVTNNTDCDDTSPLIREGRQNFAMVSMTIARSNR